MKARYLLTTSLVAVSLLAIESASAASAMAPRQSNAHVTSSSTANAAVLPAIPGPKRTIAVGKIDAIPGLTGPYTPAAAGPAVAAMLTTALDQSGRFIVAERDNLSQVLTEQDLVTNRIAQGSAGPKTGNVIPAQYLIVGAVTELSANDRGSNLGIGIGGLPSGLFGGLSRNVQSSRFALDLRLVNARTGQVEDSFSVSKELSSSSIGVTGGYQAISINGNQFWSTPLGETIRAALDEAIVRIAADVSKGGWDALVAQVNDDTIYINAGSEAGLKIGDHLVVERVTGALTDPATNAVLAMQKARLADIEVTAVDTKFATGTLTATGTLRPERGDTVVFAP